MLATERPGHGFESQRLRINHDLGKARVGFCAFVFRALAPQEP